MGVSVRSRASVGRRMPIKPLVYGKFKNAVGLPFCDIGQYRQARAFDIVANEDNLESSAAAQRYSAPHLPWRKSGNAVRPYLAGVQ